MTGRRPTGRPTILKSKARGRPVGNTGAETRERIVQTAASMFALHGLRNVSMNDIAGACGMSGPAIYNYFASKDVLYIEIICTMFGEITSALAKALNTNEGLFASLDRVLDICLEIYRDDQVLARLGAEAALEAARAPDRYPQFRPARRELDVLFIGSVTRGVASGELPRDTDIEETGAVLASIVLSGISARTLVAPSLEEFRRTIAAFRGLTRAMLGRPAGLRDTPVTLAVVPRREESSG
jgi:AcrR family transcriptional regulator